MESAPKTKGANYDQYEEWLAWHTHRDACAYCTRHDRDLEIEHYIPKEYAKTYNVALITDPTNLLPACKKCNRSKSDYHPNYGARQRRPKDTSGHAVIDPRCDDFAALYEVDVDGQLKALAGATLTRAEWNRDVLLRLNRKKLQEWRKTTRARVTNAENYVGKFQAAGASPEDLAVRDQLVEEVADRWLFIELFDINLSPTLKSLANAQREKARGTVPK
jgi:hypothetical protein